MKAARWILGALLLALAGPVPICRAQDAADFVNFAFASRMGSGVYQVDGRTLWIVRLPGSATVGKPGETRDWTLRLLFPVTIGVFDFEPVDVLETGLPERFDTVGLTPGVRFEVPTTERWTLFPFAQGGPVRDFSTDSTAWVYTVGLTSEARLPRGALEWIVRGELAWSGMSPSGEGLKATFGELTQGFEVWSPLPGRIGDARLVIGGFAVGYLYWQRARFVDGEEFQPRLYSLQWEGGVIFSTRPRTYVWRIRVPDLGLSYRTGDGFSSIRLVLGQSF